MSTPLLGSIIMFGGNFAPKGWALCNGQLVTIIQNEALFSLIGTFYGGDGINNFALPNLQGRVPKHPGSNGTTTYVIGETSGYDNITISSGQMPIHSHLVNADVNPGTQSSPLSAIPAVESTGTSLDFSSAAPGSYQMNPAMIGNAGGNEAISIVTPYLCVNFIIALTGIYPSRS